MKTNFKVLAAAVALMAVASCDEMPGGGVGNGGENGGDNGGNGAPIVNTLPFVAPEDRIVAKREGSRIEYFEYNQQGLLSKITNYRNTYNHEEGVMTTTTSFSYEGLLVKSNTTVFDVYKPYEGDQLYTSAGEGVYVKEENYYERRRTEGVLNAAGRLVGTTEYGCEYDSWESTTKEYLRNATAYTYDDNGNLLGFVKRRYESTDGNNPSSDFSCMYTWENGNPKSMNYDGDGIYNFSFRDEEYVWPGMNLYWDLDATDVYGDVDITGLDGMKFANLLHRVTATNPETNEEFAMEMVYTFDAKGRVKTVNYKWLEEGEEWYDEDDAVEFFYGDETLPAAPVTVPTYLVRQEYVDSRVQQTVLSDGGLFVNREAFSVWKKIKNVFSDGSSSFYEWTTSCGMYPQNDDGMHDYFEISRAELEQLKAAKKPAVNVSVYGVGEAYANYATAEVEFPVIGIVDMNIVINSASDPLGVLLYDSEEPSHWKTYWIKTLLREEQLEELIKYDWEIHQGTDATDGTELWHMTLYMYTDFGWDTGGLNPEKYGDWYNCTLNVPKE